MVGPLNETACSKTFLRKIVQKIVRTFMLQCINFQGNVVTQKVVPVNRLV